MSLSRSSIFILQQFKNLGRHQNGLGASCCNFAGSRHIFSKAQNNDTTLRSVSTYEVKDTEKESFVRKVLNKVPFLNLNKTRIKVAGYMQYEAIADHIDYFGFMDEFGLPDTFYSWFAITELHIWMLSTRAMADGEDGRYLRNSVVEALWNDVDQRVKKLGAGSMRLQVMELSEQFQAALIAYDEGLHSDDTVLAGALWRRFYQMDQVHVHKLEKLLKFVRMQVALLDNVSSDNIYKDRIIKWSYVRNPELST